MDNTHKVRTFLQSLTDHTLPHTPRVPTDEKTKLGFTLIIEELLELLDEFGWNVKVDMAGYIVEAILGRTTSWFDQHKEEILQGKKEVVDLAAVLKEMIDLEIVLHNLVNFSGLHNHYQNCFDNVALNNLAKGHATKEEAEDTAKQYGMGEVVKKGDLWLVVRSDGKTLKPKDFVKYDPKALLTDKEFYANWIVTDPDQLQFAFRNSERCWTYRQYDFDADLATDYEDKSKLEFVLDQWDGDMWTEATINLNEHSKDSAWDCVSGYYSKESFEQMWNSIGVWEEDGLQMICECIFEINYL